MLGSLQGLTPRAVGGTRNEVSWSSIFSLIFNVSMHLHL
jgi:hypothetical protein